MKTGDQEANQSFQDLELKEIEANGAQQIHWASTASSIEYSTSSVESLSSLDLVEDASSPTSSSPSNGPLYELSELMAQLPIKRGFSRYYQGKSQSFTSLTNVKSIEDLVKKRPAYRRKMKSCKSYTESLDNGHKIFTPKASISKKASRGYFFSSLGKRGTLVGSCRPLIHVQKHF